MECVKRYFPNYYPVKSLCTLVSLFILVCGVVPIEGWAEEPINILDGMTFVGENGEVGKQLAEYEKEEIVFEKGMFTSVSCEPYNFSSAPYSAKSVDGKILFNAVTESPTHGKISWNGVIENEEANVTFVWTKERWYWDIRREYLFKGNLKKE